MGTIIRFISNLFQRPAARPAPARSESSRGADVSLARVMGGASISRDGGFSLGADSHSHTEYDRELGRRVTWHDL